MKRAKRSNWQAAQDLIAAALDEMRLPASYWQHTMPPVSQDWMRRASGAAVRSRWLEAFDALVSRLDDATPAWERGAVEFLLAPASTATMALWRPVATLLGGRRLARAEDLCQFVENWSQAIAHGSAVGWSEDHRGAQCVLALMGTNTTYTLALWRAAAHRLCAAPGTRRGDPGGARAALFLIFVKLLQHRLLSYPEFAEAARAGDVFNPEHYSGRRARPPFYQPALDYLGLSRSRYFRLMYQRLAYEQTDAQTAGRWEDIWWLRMLSGRDYFFRALEDLEADPQALHALHGAKWSFDFGPRGHELSRRLAAFAPRTLATVSLLREDLDREIGEALEAEDHVQAMSWVRGSTQTAWALALDAPAWLVNWCARWSEPFAGAVEGLWLLGLPPMVSPESLRVFRGESQQDQEAESERYALVERFVCTHLCPAFMRISLNLDYADALAARNEEALIRRAQEDTVTAIRALGVPGGNEDRRVDALLAIKRRGSRSSRAAAEEALGLIARRHGLADAEALEHRKELAQAWSDAGLEGRQSRVWWNIGAYRVKLSAAGGKITVTAYGRRGPLKTIPRAVREHPDYEEISAARRELSQQYADFRQRLEESMIAERTYSASELAMLRSNPIFDGLIGRLVLRTGQQWVLGAQATGGPARIAHPAALLAAGELEAWQRRVVDERLVQPFKQCFREVYQPLAEELQAARSQRFAGHHVLVPRAFALLRSKGYSPGRGEARRDWPHARVQAHFTWGCDRPRLDYHFDEDGRAEPVVTGDVRFYRLTPQGKRGEALAIADVPPLIYSETMRDADLVVSLATAGELGFTSEQTLHFRLALARQLARILKLLNVAAPESGSYVVVQGQLATYRVHLGSASVFIEPTGAHVPAPRFAGRVFPRAPNSAGLGSPALQVPDYLPFEELDSRTAEVLRVIIALSHDELIEDERFRECLTRLGELTRPGS